MCYQVPQKPIVKAPVAGVFNGTAICLMNVKDYSFNRSEKESAGTKEKSRIQAMGARESEPSSAHAAYETTAYSLLKTWREII